MKKTISTFTVVSALALLIGASSVHALSVLPQDMSITNDTSATGAADRAITLPVADLNTNLTTNVDANFEANVSGSANETAASTSVASVVITRSDIAQNEQAVTHMSSASVTNDASLSLFARNVVAENEDVEKVSVNDDAVTLWYRQDAKLFGIIPIGLRTEVTADATGDVAITYPWYHFLVTTKDDVDEGTVEARVQAAISGQANAQGSVQIHAATLRARILEALESVFHTSVQASANAHADAATSVSR